MSEKDRTAGRKFLEKYLNAHISRGNRHFHTTIPPKYQSIDPYKFFPRVRADPCDSMVYAEESVDISLHESDFQRLLDILGNYETYGHANYRTKDLEVRIAFERSLRGKHPGVKKAYDRYRILLDMVAQGQDIED